MSKGDARSLAVRGPQALWPAERYFLHPTLAVRGHEVKVLFGGEDAYPAMLQAIGDARREILLETYTWASDSVGRRFAEALIERARAGVRVRAVMDALGSRGFDPELSGRLREAGVAMAEFHPVRLFGNGQKRDTWSVRDHRKLLLVDSQVAFLGGLNLAEAYAPESWGGQGWHDVQVRVRGPAAHDLERDFTVTWRYATREHVALPRRAVHGSPATGAAVQVLAIDSRRSRRLIRKHYEHALKRAQRQILIMAAYFIPDAGLRRILRKAVGRGVEVRVLLPHRSDVPIVQHASRHTYGALLRAGVQLYEWLPSMLHAKTIVVDGQWCTVGSYNLDRRSLLYNWELTMATDDRGACEALEADFERVVKEAERITLAAWRKRGWVARLVQWFAYLLRNWL